MASLRNPSCFRRMLFTFAVVPQAQFRARTRPARTGDDHTEEVAKNLSGWVHAQFPARCENGFPQHLEASKLPYCEAEKNLFADKVLLIEAANRLEIASCGEKKSTRTKIEAKIKRAKCAQQNASPQRHQSIQRHARAAARVARFESGDRLGNMQPVDPRIGVDEQQILALRSSRACIPSGRNLASIDLDDFRAGARGDLWRGVRRCIINHDDFPRLSSARRRGANRVDCCEKLQ